MTLYDRVLVLEIVCKYEWEKCAREIGMVWRALKRPAGRAKHTARSIAFVIQTDEDTAALMQRLGGSVHADCFEKAWCYSVGPNVFALDGSFDPFVTAVVKAFDDVRKRREAKYVPPPKTTGEVFIRRGIKDSEKSAAVKMGMKGAGRRKPPRDTQRPKAG